MLYMLYFHHFPYLLLKYTSKDLKSTNFSSYLPVEYVFLVKTVYFFQHTLFLYVCNQTFRLSKISKTKSCYDVKPSTYFYVKPNMSTDFRVCFKSKSKIINSNSKNLQKNPCHVWGQTFMASRNNYQLYDHLIRKNAQQICCLKTIESVNL